MGISQAYCYYIQLALTGGFNSFNPHTFLDRMYSVLTPFLYMQARVIGNCSWDCVFGFGNLFSVFQLHC